MRHSWTPNLFVIGAPKCATSALVELMRGHEDIHVPARKEHHVFSQRGFHQVSTAEYATAFRPGAGRRWRCDASTSYCMTSVYNGVIAAIDAAATDPRFVFCVRDPLPRLVSHFREELVWNRVPNDFARALRENPELLGASRYMTTLHSYRAAFGASSVLVILFEDFVHHRETCMARLSRFLDLATPLPHHGAAGRNSTLLKVYDTPLKRWLMRLPGAARGARKASSSLRYRANRLLQRPVPRDVTVPPRLRAALHSEFAESEWRPLLRELGREHDLWPSLAAPDPVTA